MTLEPAPSQHEPLAYLNGEFLPLRQARIPVWDLGIVQAVTVTETLRTFRHVPFRVDDHVARLAFSLNAIGVQPRATLDEVRRLVQHLAQVNSAALPPHSDLVLNLFISAGESQVHSGGFAVEPGRPTVCITTRPLASPTSARHYREGLALAIPSVRHIPPGIIDPRIKYRSRLHWHLADREVHASDPAAEALLLDLNGFVTETARGNIFARFGERLKTPSETTTLAGVSQQVISELCQHRAIAVDRCDMTPAELAAADEILLSSTTACLVPVTRLDARPVGAGVPGPLWTQLISDWSTRVGVDIVAQAELHSRNERPSGS